MGPRGRKESDTTEQLHFTSAGGKGLGSVVSTLETTAYYSSFSIQDKAASISVPHCLRIGQRVF